MLHECKFVLLCCDILCFDLNVAKLQFGFAHVSTGPRGGWVPRAWASKWIPLSRLENCQWTKLCSDNKPWLASPAALLPCFIPAPAEDCDINWIYPGHTHTHTQRAGRGGGCLLEPRAWGTLAINMQWQCSCPLSLAHSRSPSISSSSFRFISFRYCPIYSLQSSSLPLGPSCCFGCLCCCLISLLGLFVCRLPGDSLAWMLLWMGLELGSAWLARWNLIWLGILMTSTNRICIVAARKPQRWARLTSQRLCDVFFPRFTWAFGGVAKFLITHKLHKWRVRHAASKFDSSIYNIRWVIAAHTDIQTWFVAEIKHK